MSDPIEVAENIDAQGTIENFKIWEGGPEHQMHIIQVGNAWGVEVAWEMSGPDLTFGVGNPFANTHWELQLFLESYGKHSEYTFPDIGAGNPPITVPWGAIAQTRNWTNTITIPAATNIDPGPYRLAFMLQLYDNNTGNPYAITGFVEGPPVVFYVP